MNQVKLHLEYTKNVQKYCLNCERCFDRYNDPNVTIAKKIKRMREIYKITKRMQQGYLLDCKESPETIKKSFLECFKPTGEGL